MGCDSWDVGVGLGANVVSERDEWEDEMGIPWTVERLYPDGRVLLTATEVHERELTTVDLRSEYRKLGA